jgi:hypothetical protein
LLIVNRKLLIVNCSVMAQINLLKQTSSSGKGGGLRDRTVKIFVRLFLIILLALVGYYGWLFFLSRSIDGKIAFAQTQIAEQTQQALNLTGRGELLTRQQQLQNLNSLVAAHVYWSQIFKPLADATLNTASYSSFQVGTGNDLILSATVPSLTDLDKYMQVFNLPQINRNFSNIRISGFTIAQGKNSSGVKFNVQMQYNPNLIQYHSPNSNGG